MKWVSTGSGAPTQPAVSVIIPIHNREATISRCLRSLSSQSMAAEQFEIIIVDDGSTDSWEKSLNTASISNFRVIRHAENRGLPASLNTAIREAKGNKIVRVDSDDFVNENFLLFLKSFLDFNQEYAAVSCDYFLIDDDEQVLEKKSANEHPIACGIMFRAEEMHRVGLYDENFKLNEDKEFRHRFERLFRIGHIPIPLYRYRQHQGNMSANPELSRHYDKLLAERMEERDLDT